MPAKKKNKVAAVEAAPATPPATEAKPASVDVPAAPSLGGDSKRMAEGLKEALRMHRDLRRAEADVKEARTAMERSEVRAQELKRALKDAEKALRTEFPELDGVLDVVLAGEKASDGKKVKTPRTRRSKGAKLTPEEVDKVLDGLAKEFTAIDFSKEAERLYPGKINTPIKKIAAGKIVQVPGTSRRGTRYTRIKG